MSTEVERFWGQVDTSGVCWTWRGTTGDKGYGRFWRNGSNALAHRVAWELAHGTPSPDGMQLDHLCRNPSCVRPSHLQPVTCRENLHRSPDTQAAINAAKTHCPQGHPYSGDNVRHRKGGGRSCRTCAREYARRKHIEKQLKENENV